jgi:cytosine permease
MPLIPLVILLILLGKTCGGLSDFSSEKIIEASDRGSSQKIEDADTAAVKAEEELAAAEGDKAKLEKKVEDAEKAAKEARRRHVAETRTPLDTTNVLLFLSLYVVGFFATAGAAGVDFGMNNRNGSDVQIGGLVGIVGATVFAGGAAILIVAGAYGGGMVENVGQLDAVELMPDIMEGKAILGLKPADWMLLLLAISAFAPACFPAFIAANSFRTTLPNFGMLAVGIGAAGSILLAVTGWAGRAVEVFTVIGASFGPICGAMMADYLLSGRKWAGPRAGFNPAGWISWAVGFAVGGYDLIAKAFSKVPDEYINIIPCPPMAALIVGFLLYLVLAKAGLESEKLEMPQTAE